VQCLERARYRLEQVLPVVDAQREHHNLGVCIGGIFI
jgi:hypothetical protein